MGFQSWLFQAKAKHFLYHSRITFEVRKVGSVKLGILAHDSLDFMLLSTFTFELS